MHPDLRDLAHLLGTWRGQGRGEYPTLEPFTYLEELSFDDHGEPWLAYAERSWSPHDGATLHMERGFLRPGADATVELVLAHPIGVVEVAHGRRSESGVELEAEGDGILRSRTGLAVTGLIRRYEIAGDLMTYTVEMATEATPMAVHLRATLGRGR